MNISEKCYILLFYVLLKYTISEPQVVARRCTELASIGMQNIKKFSVAFLKKMQRPSTLDI